MSRLVTDASELLFFLIDFFMDQACSMPDDQKPPLCHGSDVHEMVHALPTEREFMLSLA